MTGRTPPTGSGRALARPELVAGAFAEAWADGDARAIADLFVPDADFVNVVGLWWRDREAIEAAHAYGFERIFAGSRMDLDRVRTRLVDPAGSTAVVHARWRVTGQRRPDGRAAGPRRGVLVFVLRRDPDGWRAVAAQNTDVVPGADSLVSDDAGSGTRAAAYRDD